MTRPRGIKLLVAIFQAFRAALILRHRFNTVHANGLTEVLIALPINILLGKRVVVWVHNSEKPRPFRLIEKALPILAKDWQWYAVSNIARELVSNFKIEIARNPIDPDFRPKGKRTSERLRVGYLAGTDRFNKGFDLLSQLVNSTLDEAVEWFIYTSPPFSSRNADCQRAWESLLAVDSRSVHILPRTEKVAEALYELDLVVSPSRNESYNRVLAESIATGTPFIASDIEAHKEHLARSDAGILFLSGNADSAVETLRSLTNNRNLVEKLASAAWAASSGYQTTETARIFETAWR